jgi:hypothetical protein
MNFKKLFVDLKAAIAERRITDAMRLVSEALKGSADLADMLLGGGAAAVDDCTVEVDELLAVIEEAKQDTAVIAAGAAIDPGTVFQLVLLVVELWKQFKKK